MVKNYLLIIVCALCFSSCTKENSTNSALYFKSVSPKVDARSSNPEEDSKYDTLVWCTGNDIEWYNATTGELKLKYFSELPYSLFKLIVFLEEKQLFSLETSNTASSISTAFPCINWDEGKKMVHKYKGVFFLETNEEPHYHDSNCEWEELVYCNPGYYISKGYPRMHPIIRELYINMGLYSDPNWYSESPSWADIDAACEKNWKAIEPGYNLFLEQLKKEGKYRE